MTRVEGEIEAVNRAARLSQAAEDYCQLLGREFPTLCLQDEFIFFPRVAEARHHFHRVAQLEETAIEAAAAEVARLLESLADLGEPPGQGVGSRAEDRLPPPLPQPSPPASGGRGGFNQGWGREFEGGGRGGHRLESLCHWSQSSSLNITPPLSPSSSLNLEAATDLTLLRQSMLSFLREMGEWREWARDPLLYLKVASLSLAPVLEQSPLVAWQEEGHLEALLAQIARLFRWGRAQVAELSQPHKEVAREAFDDTAAFWAGDVTAFFEVKWPQSSWWRKPLQEALRELARFRDRVAERPGSRDFRLGPEGLTRRLRESWGVEADLDDIARVLRQEEAEVKAALDQLRGRINHDRSWQELVADYRPPAETPTEPLELYRREVARLEEFWRRHPLLPPAAGALAVAATPIYLQAVRAAASYTAPWLPQEGLPGIFYISPAVHEPAHRWRQHRFLSAHETYPGHHYLDMQRLRLTSPIRRRYESPLYYEGWASYAESLLMETGYLADPMDLMVGYHRRLWRAVRGQVDLEMQTRGLDLDQAVQRLAGTGYPFPARQVVRWALNPGYQLCYTLGHREILRLRQRFGPELGVVGFHAELLRSGQAPFPLVEKRLRQALLDR